MEQLPLKFCPVPTEQQPVHEYEELKKSWFFQWATFSRFRYARKLLWIWFLSLSIVAPIASASFPPQKATLEFILASALGGSLFVAVALLRLYLGWFYIGDRLNQDKIIYEESGWYDGQVWQKPPEVIARDRLIFAYQVQPLLQRIRKSALLLMGSIAASSLIFFLI